MKVSIQTIFDGTQQGPLRAFVEGVGRAIEDRGFHAIWQSEHVVSFRHYDPRDRYPYSDDGVAPAFLAGVGMLDPMSMLTALAMCTTNIELGTGIAILPQRNPVYFAKMGTAIDLLSGGRFVAGVGLGWSSQEFASVGVPFEHRGSRMDEYVEVVRRLWTGDEAAFDGRFVTMPACVQLPCPARRPHPPFIFGGESPAALRRTARYGQGWFGYRLSPDALSARLATLNEMLLEQGRSRGELTITVSPHEDFTDADAMANYASIGADQINFAVLDKDIDAFRRRLDDIHAITANQLG